MFLPTNKELSAAIIRHPGLCSSIEVQPDRAQVLLADQPQLERSSAIVPEKGRG